ncbi:MAG: class I SAM-dependent methyltransferase [Bacteroidia bacterium]|nr:class I SAM-dependent methyltransferase [Bacteroidia bacterium]
MSGVSITKVKPGFYEKTLLKLLSAMRFGRLELTLPDGEQLIFGNGIGNISANISVKDPYFFKRCILYGDIGFGESYVEGEWDTHSIQNVISWIILNIENAPGVSGSKVSGVFQNVLRFLNRFSHNQRSNSLSGSRRNISEHYDLNNAFFGLFLDPSMTYSSAYFVTENMSLEDAQMAKYDRLCKELRLKKNDRVLEIGSGWGANAIFIAKNYGCQVTSVTISEEQYKYAKEKIEKEKLSDKITLLLKDYRDLEGKFDKIVSIEMLEAVGAEYYNSYFKKCSSLLNKEGILALQVITCPDSRFESLKKGVDWIQKHIFPGSLLPSVAAINQSVNEVSDLTLVDLKDIGMDYANTLNIWQKNFNNKISEVKRLGFDDYFIRKWNYYLSYCEAAFAMRNINVMQMVYTRPNNTLR